MTSVCFVHDAPLHRNDHTGEIYSQGFQYHVWRRYLQVFDSVIVCTRMRHDAPPTGAGISSGTRVEFLPARTYKNPLSFLVKLPKVYAEVFEAVSHADAVILRLPSKLGLLGYVAARWSNKQYMVELVGSPHEAYSNSGMMGRILAPLMASLNKYIVRHAPYCLYVTERYLQHHYPTDGTAIGVSDVVLEASSQPPKRVPPKETLRLGSSSKVDVRYKGHESVVSALVDLPNVVYEIAGSGDPSRIIAQANRLGVQDQIKILGQLSREDLFAWLDTLDLYVQPSLTEGLPRAVVEAMSRGLPVIGSNVGGIPELLPDSCLFPPGDPEAIRNTIAELSEQDRFIELGMANYKRAKDFDPFDLQERRKRFFSAFRHHVLRESARSASI